MTIITIYNFFCSRLEGNTERSVTKILPIHTEVTGVLFMCGVHRIDSTRYS